MARLRVGDIEIDGTRVTIGGADPVRPPSAPRGPVQPGNYRLLRLLQRLPVPASALLAVGVVLAAAGTVVNAVVGVTADPFGALVRGGVLAPLGFGVTCVALLKAYLARRPDIPLAAALGGDPEGYVERLRPLLHGEPLLRTVPALAGRAGWPESTVVRVLALMRERGEVEEDVDLDTGEFCYAIASFPPRNLDARLGTLHSPPRSRQ